MGNVNMEAYQVHYKGEESVADKLKEVDTIGQQIEDLSGIVSIKSDRIDIAPTFSEENAYSAGDLVYNSGRLWQFSADHAAGAWDPEEVSAANIDIVRNDLQEEVDELKNTLTETVYGQLNTNKAKLYLSKKSGIAFLAIEELSSIAAGASSIEDIVPVGYRPGRSYRISLLQRASSFQRIVQLTVTSSGNIDIYNYGSAITEELPFSGTISYPIV